jgi:hypothetical protein
MPIKKQILCNGIIYDSINECIDENWNYPKNVRCIRNRISKSLSSGIKDVSSCFNHVPLGYDDSPDGFKRCKRCNEVKEHSEFTGKKISKRGSCKSCDREKWYEKKYGITKEQKDLMIKDSEGKCNICGSESPNSSWGWHLDHCHKTGKVRGILCMQCNTTLGKLEIVGVDKFLKYLENAEG